MEAGQGYSQTFLLENQPHGKLAGPVLENKMVTKSTSAKAHNLPCERQVLKA